MDDDLAAAEFERLLRAHARSMLQFADFVLHDRSAAEDAAQEAFVVAWRRRATLRTDSSFSAWLRTIVLRECLRWRRRSLLGALSLSDRVAVPATADSSAHLDLARAIRRLTPALRAVIYLHFYEDQTLKALAAQLGIPESTAKTRLYEALGRLRTALPAYASTEEAQP
jgi:RNA polymerase sigma-70 factor (ECF subfamily)